GIGSRQGESRRPDRRPRQGTQEPQSGHFPGTLIRSNRVTWDCLDRRAIERRNATRFGESHLRARRSRAFALGFAEDNLTVSSFISSAPSRETKASPGTL